MSTNESNDASAQLPNATVKDLDTKNGPDKCSRKRSRTLPATIYITAVDSSAEEEDVADEPPRKKTKTLQNTADKPALVDGTPLELAEMLRALNFDDVSFLLQEGKTNLLEKFVVNGNRLNICEYFDHLQTTDFAEERLTIFKYHLWAPLGAFQAAGLLPQQMKMWMVDFTKKHRINWRYNP
jgi:hypothetical protein